jgi:hypothetical protein
MTMMTSKYLFLTMVLGLCAAVSYGCAAPLLVAGAAAGGTVGYVAGELTSTKQVTFKKAWEATRAAMGDLGYAITKEEHDPADNERTLTARAEGDEKVTVKLVKKEDRLTEIGIRVGIFGDKKQSAEILNAIEKRL